MKKYSIIINLILLFSLIIVFSDCKQVDPIDSDPDTGNNTTTPPPIDNDPGTGNDPTTPPPSDDDPIAIPPSITDIKIENITNGSANITWKTDKPADSQIEYGTNTSYGKTSGLNKSMLESHIAVISGLNRGTKYHYRLKSADASGNLTVSDDYFFSTAEKRTGSSEYYSQWSKGLPSDPGFFPVGVWLQSTANASRYRNIGINVYVGQFSTPDYNALNTFTSEGMYVICSQNSSVLSLSNNSIIKSWQQQDEPDNNPCTAPSVLAGLYNQWKAKDATRPIFLNFGQGVADIGWVGRGFLTNIGGFDYSPASGNYSLYYTQASEAADIVAFDIYPVTCPESYVSGRLEYLSSGVKNLISWTNNKKQVWNFIETTHISNASLRPSAAQVKSEVWMSIIAGSMGIAYFVHEWQPSFREDGIFRYQDIVDAVTAINAQIKSLAHVLNSPNIEDLVQVSSGNQSVPIDMMVKVYNNDLFVLTASLRNAVVTGTFSIKGMSGGTVEVLGENREITLTNGIFQDNFAGYGVHLYRIIAE